MGTKIRKELILGGLDCANCADKIEKKVSEIKGIDLSSMNFVTKTLTIEIKSTEDIELIIQQVRKIVRKLEPDITVNEKVIQKAEKKSIILMGLG